MNADLLSRHLGRVRSVLRRRNIKTRKHLGQHFMLDRHILGNIVAAAAPLGGRTVLEVGPGPGCRFEARSFSERLFQNAQ